MARASRKRWRGLVRGSLFLGAAGASAVFFIDYCHLLFDCGCVSLWAGGAAHCNVQTPGPPDCPFCAHGDLSFGSLLATLGAQGALLYWPGRLGTPVRGLLAFLAFPVLVGAVALASGLHLGYWD